MGQLVGGQVGPGKGGIPRLDAIYQVEIRTGVKKGVFWLSRHALVPGLKGEPVKTFYGRYLDEGKHVAP